MTISIITPYRNAARWLPTCVNSLMAQPGDFEFILVNDYSEDNGPEIVEGVRFMEGQRYGEDELFVLSCLAKDNRIRHVESSPVIHCYVNDESLIRVTNEEDIITQNINLLAFLMKQTDPEIRRGVCNIMAKHWSSKPYLRLICG